MDERTACAALKRRFEAAGFQIAENVPFDEDGVRFEIDGFDAERRVGYEFISEEAGDSWDVGDDVIEALDKRREAGDVFVFFIAESAAPDEATLLAKADAFLGSLEPPAKPAAKKPPAKKPVAKPAAKKSAAKKPAAKKPAPKKKAK